MLSLVQEGVRGAVPWASHTLLLASWPNPSPRVCNPKVDVRMESCLQITEQIWG